MPRIVLEPIGEELDCGDDETVLDAAFRAGLSLVHGCREGQCSACKCYLLEGEVSLRPYSTFALSDSESEQGYTLLCRAMPDDDEVVVELLHWDPDTLRMEHPIVDGRAVVERVEALTHDISRVVLRPAAAVAYAPGMYVDVHVPDGSGQRRSFSMAGLPEDGTLELVIKRYPGGLLSGMLGDGRLHEGLELGFTGPYGALRLRDTPRPVLLAAGGSGMAPVFGLLRALAAQGCPRPVRFVYGARTQADLFWVDEVRALGTQLPDFAFVPVLSDEAWEGERGMAHEAVARLLDDGFGPDVEAYLCGPPPMVDATIELLVDGRGVDARQVHFDKFTTAVAASGQEAF